MAETSAGSVVYTVDVETAALTTAGKATKEALDGLQKGFDKTDRSAASFSGQMTKTASSVKAANREITGVSSSMSGLTKVIGAYLSLRTIQSLVALSDQYGQMASRIRQATSSTAEYESVQARLLDTANKTFRPLSEAQEVYIRTADALRALGYNTEQALDVTDSLSFLLVTNAASAERGASAINAYSKAIQTGKVDSDSWQSILAATPTIVDSIAAATGRTASEIRNLGITGKLSLEALNEALLQSRDANEQLAAEMETSVHDAFTAFTNSLQVFVGKVNESSGASGILTQSVGKLSELLQDPKTIAAAQTLAGGVVTAFNTIILGAKSTVEAVQWLGEELAVFFNGIGTHDVERLEGEMSRLQGLLDKLREEGSGPGTAIFDNVLGSFNENQAKLDQAYRLLDLSRDLKKEAAVTPGNAAAPASNAPTVQAEAAAVENLRTKRAALTDAQKASIAAAKAEKAGIEQNIDAFGKLGAELAEVGQSARDVAMQQAELSLNRYATPEQVQQVRDMAGALYDLQNAKAQQALLGQMDPVAGAQIAFEDQLSKLQQLNDAKLLSDQRYLELKAQAEAAYDEQSRALQEENFRRQSTLNALMLDGIEAFGQGATTALAGIGSGTFNAQEAFQSLANTILQAGVGALVQLGVQALKTALIQQTAAAVAGSAYAVSVAAQVSTTSALAAQAAYASTAAIPIIGPAAAPAAAATAAAAAASLGAPAIASAAGVAAGGRLYGGSVAAGEMYRVNENGAPEIYSAANGQQFMMPNQRGEVISNADATGGAGVVNYVTITIDSAGNSSTDSTGADSDARSLANAINVAVINSLERESRQGGILWQQRQNNG